MSLWKIQGLSFKAKAKVKDSTIKEQDKDKAIPLKDKDTAKDSKIVLKDTSSVHANKRSTIWLFPVRRKTI